MKKWNKNLEAARRIALGLWNACCCCDEVPWALSTQNAFCYGGGWILNGEPKLQEEPQKRAPRDFCCMHYSEVRNRNAMQQSHPSTSRIWTSTWSPSTSKVLFSICREPNPILQRPFGTHHAHCARRLLTLRWACLRVSMDAVRLLVNPSLSPKAFRNIFRDFMFFSTAFDVGQDDLD